MNGIKVKILDNQDEQAWNRFVDFSPWGDILQMWQWGELKKTQGWKPLRIGVIRDGFLILTAQILMKPVPFLGNYAHVPHGPVFHSKADLEVALPYFVEFISRIGKTYDFAVVEIEPKIGKLAEAENSEFDSKLVNNLSHYFDPEIIEIFTKNKFIITNRNVEPVHKLYYDLGNSEEKLLSQCQKNTRYNIKLAEKKGVVVKEYLPDSPEIKQKLSEFFELVKITQERAKGYPVRDLKTYIKLFELFKGTDHLSLFEASFEGEIIVMNISQRNKFWSSSFYAGSNRKHTNVKAPYLLRWKAIQRAKEHGSKTYDFWGIVPGGKHAGYSDHKLSFGGTRIDNYGLLALPINPIKYELWDLAIWIRTKGKIKTREFLFNSKNQAMDLVTASIKKTKNWIQNIFSKTSPTYSQEKNNNQKENYKNTETIEKENTYIKKDKTIENSQKLLALKNSNLPQDKILTLEPGLNTENLATTTNIEDSPRPLALITTQAKVVENHKHPKRHKKKHKHHRNHHEKNS